MNGQRGTLVDKELARLAATGTTLPSGGTLADTLPPLPKRKQPALHKEDLPDFVPGPRGDVFYRELERLASARQKGDCSYRMLHSVGSKIFYVMTVNARWTEKQIAKACKCSAESVRLARKFLQAGGLFGSLNVMVRVKGQLRRSANFYIAPWCIKTTARMSRRVAERTASFIADCARILGLHARPLGLNTTPLRATPPPRPGFT